MSDGKMLPKLEILTNIPITVVFPYGDCRVIPSKKNPNWAPSYLYTVELNGAAHAWFATELVHNILSEKGVGKGAIVTVLKREKKSDDGKNRVEWDIDVLDPGEPVAQRVRNQGEAGGSESPEKAPATRAVAPGSREGAEARLAELGAAYAACIDEARGVWLRSGHGLAGKLDFETVHSTASVFMIAITREGFDLAAFASSYGESEGTKALRRLIERTKTEPHLADVREHFSDRLETLPTDPAQQRALYVELREAVKSMTMAAAENTPVDEEELPFTVADLKTNGDGPKPNITKARPAFMAGLEERAKKVWPDNGQWSDGLQSLVQRVTKDEARGPVDLTEEEATIVARTMDTMLTRMKRA